MIMSRLILLLITVPIHQVINIPLGPTEKQAEHIATSSNHIPAIVTSHHEEKKLSVVVPLTQAHHAATVDSSFSNARNKKGLNIPLSLPVPHHLLIPTNLHVIPIHHNIHQGSIHTGVNLVTNEHINLPFISHSYSHSSSNVTHSTPLLPILIRIHTHLVPLHDLSVIPLHRPDHNVGPKLSHYRTAIDKRGTNDEEPMNRYRFIGGYGNGLDFGGHGAGHGFYVGTWS